MTGPILLLSACVAAVFIVAPARLARTERWGILLFVVVVGCVGVGGLLAAPRGPEALADGRALIPCVIGPLLALSLRSELLGRFSGPLIGGAGTILLVAGLAGQATVLAGMPGARATVMVALALAAVAASVAAGVSTSRAMARPSALLVARGLGEAVGVGVIGLGALVAGVELAVVSPITPTTTTVATAHLWPGLTGLGALISVTTRTSAMPLSLRDAALTIGGGAMAFIAMPETGLDVVPAVGIGLVAMHGLWPAVIPGLQPARPPAVVAGVDVAPGALRGVAPVVDDPALRALTARPRVLARTPARRLIDAAIERAWRSLPNSRGRAPIDVIGGDDVDVDGDASDLAEALGAVLDGALRAPRPADGRVTVTVRAAPQSISFEVDDVGVDPEARPFLDRPAVHGAMGDGEREGFDGALGLARARLLVERHGGQLHLRRGERGAVHLTLPRRLQRGPVGLA